MSESPIEEDAPEVEIPVPEESPVEDNWEVEITVLARNSNEVTQVSNIQSENKIVVNNMVTDSELLRILNFIQPKAESHE